MKLLAIYGRGLERATGFEPATLGLGSQCSGQLSYTRNIQRTLYGYCLQIKPGTVDGSPDKRRTFQI